MAHYAHDATAQTPCPTCPGTGFVRGVRVNEALKILTYVCDSCHRSWNGMEQLTGLTFGPPVIQGQIELPLGGSK